MKTTSYPNRAGLRACILSFLLLSLSPLILSQAQPPVVTVRLANPAFDCNTGEYCLDVEFRSNQPGQQLFGMNVRFFYPDNYLELIGLSDYQGGYGPVAPNPPQVTMTVPGSATAAFGFPAPGVADYVNGAIQLLDNTQPPIILSTTGWTKLYQICFLVDGPVVDSTSFCPPIVWDLELNPANGGYLPGDDGVVMTVVSPDPNVMSVPTTENVVQFNWMYTGTGNTPYGAPNPTQCVSVACPIDLALTKDIELYPAGLEPGDDVDFIIGLANQGDVTLTEIHVVDYIPTGFSLNDPDWTAGNLGTSGQSASIILSVSNGLLPAGGFATGDIIYIYLTLHISNDIPPGEYENFAEISAMYDTHGTDVSENDIDSHPDTNDTNDPDTEDDFDGVVICLLNPPLIDGRRFNCPGESVVYTVEDYNPAYTYTFNLLNGGGIITNITDSSVTIAWGQVAGGPFQLSVHMVGPLGCEETTVLDIFLEEVTPIACIDQINISIDNDCGTVVTSGMILTGEMEGVDSYEVFVIDMNGDTIPNATLTWEHVGKIFKVSVVNGCTGQSCWGWIKVEDKLGPIINCVCSPGSEDRRCTITCLQVDAFLHGDIPEALRPEVVDNCGGTTLTLLNVDLHYESCSGGYITVDWLATDGSGNTSACTQEFRIEALNLESLQFPEDYQGECGGSGNPDITGWPQVYAGNITDIPGYCNIISAYSDKVFATCGGGTKIMRTWTVFDWCIPTKVDHVQFIYLNDHTGPVINCPKDITVGMDAWSCLANVQIPRIQANDLCSDVATYLLLCPDGTVIKQGNNYIIQGLAAGSHTATWIVTDECYNRSTCSFRITVVDNIPPSVSCHLHTIVSLTSDRPNGLTLVPADAFDDGSVDNCGPVTFRARRMDSCLEFDWTTEGACMDETPGGNPPINSRDHGTVLRDCVPFACCDIGRSGLMIELEVTDAAGNKNYCMVEVEVQDKLAPTLTCPGRVLVSCDFHFNVEEGIFRDANGNQNGSLDEDPLSEIFGNMYDAARYTQSDRGHIIINDPGNTEDDQPYDWGLEGWATDNCELEMTVEVRVTEDCTGQSLPGNHPRGAVKLIERIFSVSDGVQTRSCTQQIWVVDFHPFKINDTDCTNSDPLDGIIWPCDVIVNTCPDEIGDTGEPVILDDGCSIIGVSHKDTRYDFVDSVCFKILREWKILDWCQYDANTGKGLWTYVQTIKVADQEGVDFLDAPTEPVSFCVSDPGITLPANNQIFLGEGDPEASSCSVHADLALHVHEGCSGSVLYDVKVYPFNGQEYLQMVPETEVILDDHHDGELRMNTQTCGIPDIELNGLPYNSPECGDYHRILWTVEDGCGNRSYADYLFRLEDCKNPTPVCINGISTVVMQGNGQVTVSAASFNASSYDDCTPGDDLLFSFSGDNYQPTYTYTCENVPAFGIQIPVQMWAADGGSDINCNDQVDWSERNKAFCVTYIIITDPNNVCDNQGGILQGEVMTEHTDAVSNVAVRLSSPGQTYPEVVTAQDGKFTFQHLIPGEEYTLVTERTDNPRNGVSTLDLVKIQKHLLGQETFSSPYQYIAADANNNQSVSAIDLIEIRKVILGLQDEFSNNTSWRFVHAGTPMAPGNPWPFDEQIETGQWDPANTSDMKFIGVKIGDINNSVQANSDQVLPRNANQVMHITVNGKSNVQAGEEVDIQLTFPEVISGFQWTLDCKGLEWAGVTSDDIHINEQNVGRLKSGLITMSWNGEYSGHDQDPQNMIMHLTFRARESGRLMDMIHITDEVTQAEVYTKDEEILDVDLAFNSAGIFTDYALYQNKPNPWNSHTIIGFHLPVDAAATLTVYDLNGKVIKVIHDQYKAGYNSAVLTADDLSSSGVYYYRLESGSFVASKKMVMVK